MRAFIYGRDDWITIGHVESLEDRVDVVGLGHFERSAVSIPSYQDPQDFERLRRVLFLYLVEFLDPGFQLRLLLLARANPGAIVHVSINGGKPSRRSV